MKVFGISRLTKAPEVRYSTSDKPIAIAHLGLACERRGAKKDAGEQTADFFNAVAFGKTAEFIEKYLDKGSKVFVEGHLQSGSYTNKDGVKVYTTDIVIDNIEFAESKGAKSEAPAIPDTAPEDFINIPDGIDDELPFN